VEFAGNATGRWSTAADCGGKMTEMAGPSVREAPGGAGCGLGDAPKLGVSRTGPP